jgi:predicted peroxiredoxin
MTNPNLESTLKEKLSELRPIEELHKELILYVQTSGIETSERLLEPFILAETAISLDVNAIIFFVGEGITVMKREGTEHVKIGDQQLNTVIKRAVKAGVKLLVCEESCEARGIGWRDIKKEALVLGAITLNDLLIVADAVISF